MSRTVREQWGELHKFMSRVSSTELFVIWAAFIQYSSTFNIDPSDQVKAKYPTSQCFLKQDKLYVDNR